MWEAGRVQDAAVGERYEATHLSQALTRSRFDLVRDSWVGLGTGVLVSAGIVDTLPDNPLLSLVSRKDVRVVTRNEQGRCVISARATSPAGSRRGLPLVAVSQATLQLYSKLHVL